MELSDSDLLEISQFAFSRMDGAWFMALAVKYGIETAWDMDVQAWKQFPYVFGKKLRKSHIPEPVWPESFIEGITILSKVLKIEGRELIINSGKITVRVTDCEIQKGISKAGIADCGIVTVETYKGLVKGLFNKEINIDVEHTKNLNQGDGCCEVVIRKI